MNRLSSVGGCLIRKFQPPDAAVLCEIATQSPGAAQWSPQSYEQLSNLANGTGIRPVSASPGLAVDKGIAPPPTSPIISNVSIWVAESARNLCAFLVVRVASDEAEILNLAVKPVHRRQGIASRLLQTALQDCIAAGVHRVFLEVRESNLRAITFYEQFGFAKSGRRNRYYRDAEEAAIMMDTKLTG